MSAVHITKNNFTSEVLHSEKTVLLDFWAPWCGPCRMVSPIVDEIAAERTDIKVGKINVDEEPELAAEFNVMSIPTLVVIKDGKIAEKKTVSLPERLVNVISCKNPRCITSCEQELDQVFTLTDKENRVYRCLYCETKAKEENH